MKVVKGYHPAYPVEKREQAVAAVRSGRPISHIAKEHAVSDSTIRYWAKNAGVAIPGRMPSQQSVTTGGNRGDELAQLRSQNVVLREQRDMLVARSWELLHQILGSMNVEDVLIAVSKANQKG